MVCRVAAGSQLSSGMEGVTCTMITTMKAVMLMVMAIAMSESKDIMPIMEKTGNKLGKPDLRVTGFNVRSLNAIGP